MQKKDKKYISIELYPELHYKLHYIAKCEGRSANGQILYLLRRCIQQFERENGEIIVPESGKKES